MQQPLCCLLCYALRFVDGWPDACPGDVALPVAAVSDREHEPFGNEGLHRELERFMVVCRASLNQGLAPGPFSASVTDYRRSCDPVPVFVL